MDDWQAVLAVEGTPTGDGRFFELGSFGWRDLPLTLLYMPATADQHDGSFPIGSITSIARVSTGVDTADIVARGTFAQSTDADVLEAQRMIREGHQTGVSVDFSMDLFMLAPPDEGVSMVTEDGEPIPDAESPMEDAGEAWMQVENVVTMQVQAATIMAATVVATPAFAEGMIAPMPAPQMPMMASAAPAIPPAAWFADPMLEQATPLTISADGRVYGHLAAWGSCHIGMPDCVQPPHSATDYALFRLGERETTAGPVPVGQITLDTNHAPMTATAARAREHYEHTGAVVADVSAGEDPFGIWVAGSLRPGLTDEQVIELRAAKLSGDWRDQGQGLDLVGALAVNVPGFPVPRMMVAGGDRDRPLALVAAGSLRCATRAARVYGRITKVRAVTASVPPTQTVTFTSTSTDEDGTITTVGWPVEEAEAIAELDLADFDLRALADRARAPELARLANRAAEPELQRLAARL